LQSGLGRLPVPLVRGVGSDINDIPRVENPGGGSPLPRLTASPGLVRVNSH
jgi:hypothetical protein